nr:zinc-binding alcohol dehydrogenase family protein [uncultured Janthinobacterium sp.]
MKMIGFKKGSRVDAPGNLFDTTAGMPVPGPRDVLVRVRAVGVNPLDTKVRAGLVAVPDNVVSLGWDAAGTVHAVGSAATLFAPGQAVYYAGSFDRTGAHAEYHLADERSVGRMPATLDFAQAASVPLTGFTVIATASRGDSADWCRAMGAHHVIDHTLPLAPQVAALGVAPVQHIAALSHTARHVAALAQIIAPHGKLAVIDDHEHFDAPPLKGKSVSLHWEMVFTRPLYGTPDMIGQHHILNRVADLLEQGVLRPTLRQRLSPMDAATLRHAHALLERGGQPGKVVVSAG